MKSDVGSILVKVIAIAMLKVINEEGLKEIPQIEERKKK